MAVREKEILSLTIFPLVFSIIIYFLVNTPAGVEKFLVFLPYIEPFVPYLIVLPFCVVPLNFTSSLIEEKQ